MNELPCGCCEGVHVATPESVANRPGLLALRYRAGTHRSFLSTMLARLSAFEFPGLARLTTRDPSDPAIALLDAWATVAHVLTFYQERIANEGYLRTATELRSVLELARLVGYEPRPGVAASTHLAFQLEKDNDEIIPPGTKAQSLPVPGQLPQVYETSEPLAARYAFNNLQMRMSRPQAITRGNADGIAEMWLAGTATRLQANDVLVVVIGEGASARTFLRFVDRVEEDFEADRTRVLLLGGRRPKQRPWVRYDTLEEVIDLVVSGVRPPVKIDAKPPGGVKRTDTALRLAQVMRPEVASVLYRAWANAVVTRPERVRVYAMRVKASPFGHNAPRLPVYANEGTEVQPMANWPEWPVNEGRRALFLDNPYPNIKSGSIVAVSTPAGLEFHGVDDKNPIAADLVSRSEYGLTAKTTRIRLSEPGWTPPTTMTGLRATAVYAQSELLDLAEQPITTDVCRMTLELGELYEALEPGRKLVVSGERADLPGVSGVMAAELVTIAEVRQGPIGENGNVRPGDTNHTFVVLAAGGLRYCYARETVKVYGNVVHATHGDSRSEVLGSGDATVTHQAFALRSIPLTHVSAPTPSGVQSTLEVRVDDVRWPARPWFMGLEPEDRGYVTRTDDQHVTTVVGGNGVEGRRFPTGRENIRARYRMGIGAPGNTDAGRITLLLNKPLSVREVVNPVPATGGADAEGRDEAREHAPLPIKALDRLVSAADYADFALTFAGVGKAVVDRLVEGHRQVLVVSIAGAAGIPVDPGSDLVANLRRALRRFGDPSLPLKVLVADRLVLRLSATVSIDPDYEWASVEPKVRAALLERFSFERRSLGDDVAESEVVACIHTVPGVVSVVVVDFDSEPPGGPLPVGFHPARRVVARGARREDDGVRPAEHLFLAPELPEFLVLTEATP